MNSEHVKKLGLWNIVGLGVGSAVGSGIFVTLGSAIAKTGRSTLPVVIVCVFYMLLAYWYNLAMSGIFVIRGTRFVTIFQNLVTVLLVLALILFVVMGLPKVDAVKFFDDSYDSGFFHGGMAGLISAIAIMDWACQGTTMSPVGVVAVVYGLMSYVAAGVLPYERRQRNLNANDTDNVNQRISQCRLHDNTEKIPGAVCEKGVKNSSVHLRFMQHTRRNLRADYRRNTLQGFDGERCNSSGVRCDIPACVLMDCAQSEIC